MATSAQLDAVSPPLTACEPILVEFDFDKKVERPIPLAGVKPAFEAGKFVWIDVDVSQLEAARQILSDLALIAPEIIEDALSREPATQIARYDDYVHLVMSGCRLQGDKFDLERVDALVGEQFLLTIHRGPVVFLDAVRKAYPADFRRFARSPSFLLYELWDHLIDNYLSVQKKFEERVDRVQHLLIGDVEDKIFEHISELNADILHLRKVVMPSRSVLTDLSSRKSVFVSEATQPFLGNMVGTLERVLQDLSADRDILSESLNLYMSAMSHRTNRVMNRLTVVSVIFLPLTFLCGIWGMNFGKMPELEWKYGYALFWILCVSIAGGLLWLMRRAKLL